MKNYDVMIDGKNFFHQPVKSDIRTYDNIWKITKGEGDDYTNGCFLDYDYLKEHYKMIAIDLNDQQALDSDQKPIQPINYTTNLEEKATIFSIIKEAKETVLDFSQRTIKVF